MKLVFDHPKSLKDTPYHFCPGCHHGLIHRLVAEAIDYAPGETEAPPARRGSPAASHFEAELGVELLGRVGVRVHQRDHAAARLGPQGLGEPLGLLGAVNATEEAQQPLVQALHAQADPVDTGGAPAGPETPVRPRSTRARETARGKCSP